jgi:hypothetical protein
MVGQTKRIAHGRGHRYLLDGETADGVTRVTGDGVSKPGLVRWAARSVAGYAIDHWDELNDMKASERLRTLEGAAWAERDEAAGRGRDVHALVERLQAGEEVQVPEPLTGHVDAYLAFDRDWKPNEILVEAVVVSRAHRYMGTLDVVARLADGDLWLIDWKTGGSGVFPEVALQLAAYRYAEVYLDRDGIEHDMPQVDRCGALWLRADGYDLYPVEAGHDQFRRFQYAQVLAKFVNEPRETLIGEAVEPPRQLEAVS